MAATTLVSLTLEDLDLALTEPFGIATGVQPRARNLIVRARLANGVEGLGEAAPFPAVNGETREMARTAIESVTSDLVGWDARAWRALGPWLGARIGSTPSARCGVETALIDALGRTLHLPLWVLFGGVGHTLRTDMTITTGTPAAAASAATRIAHDGFDVIKLKVGGVALDEDIARVDAVVRNAPGCGLLIDANGAFSTADEAIALIDTARRAGGRVVCFEQPAARHDLATMADCVKRAGVPIAADESVGSVADLLRVIEQRAAHVVNIKTTKCGLVEALDIAATARAHGLGLMVGGMVESQVAMATSAAMAAGQGGFGFVDLDTPMFLADEPFEGPMGRTRTPVIELGGVDGGHGVRFARDPHASD